MYSRNRSFSKKPRRNYNQTDNAEVTLKKEINVSCGQVLRAVPTEDITFEDAINPRESIMSHKIEIVNSGCTCISIFDILRQSEYFDNFASLYDQIKINAIKVDILAIDWPQSVNNTGNVNDGFVYPKSLTVVTAWDRSGLGPNQVQFNMSRRNVTSPDYPINENLQKDILDNEKFFYCTVGNNVSTYSSALSRHLGPGNSLKISRYLYPENLNEKSQYVSVDLLKPQYNYESEDNSYSMYGVLYRDSNERLVRDIEVYDWNIDLPTNLLASPSLPFKPVFMIGVMTADGPTYQFTNGELNFKNMIKPCTFCLDFSIDVTFRGLRYNKLIK